MRPGFSRPDPTWYQTLTATVGVPMPPLRALDEQGRDFDLQTLLGRRVMVKFFRGSW